MAYELSITYPGDSATIYALIRRQSDNYVWNGSAFAAWADGSIGSYDIPLTARGGDLYNADFPSGIDAATYVISYYQQAGASPAITDLLLMSTVRRWSGDTLSPGGSVSVDAYALTSLANLEAFESVGDIDDTLGAQVINAASAMIERATGRNFKARDYTHRFNGVRQTGIVLSQRPVNSVTRVAWGMRQAASVTYSGAAIRATASVTDTDLRLVTVSAAGTTTSSTLTWASYPTISTLKTAVDAISGWSLTQSADWPTKELYPSGGETAKSATVAMYYPDQDEHEYAVDYERGIVRFRDWQEWVWRSIERGPNRAKFPNQWQGVTVSYNAGYSSIPADVEYLCTMIAAALYHNSIIDNDTTAATLGPYSVSYGGEWTEVEIRKRLANYIDATGYVG